MQSRPDWVKDGYPTYPEMVGSWGYEVLEEKVFGSYQGDYAFLLKDGDLYGLSVIGYGSCTGCDMLEALTPYVPWGEDGSHLDWTELIEFSESCRNTVSWYESLQELKAETLRRGENSWFSFEDDFPEWITGLTNA